MAAQPVARRAYIGLTVTLTTATVLYRLLDLVSAALAPSEAPASCREFTIQNAAGNASSIYVGQAVTLAAAMCGYELAPGAGGTVGASRTYRGVAQNVDIGSLYVKGGADGLLLNVEIMVF